jgi:hypothetical protein
MDTFQMVVVAVAFKDGLVLRSFADEPDSGTLLAAVLRGAQVRRCVGLAASPVEAVTWWPLPTMPRIAS